MLEDFNTFNKNGISVQLVLDTDYKSIIHFSSNKTSNIKNFIQRLEDPLDKVIDFLREQRIPFHIKPTIYFDNAVREIRIMSIENFDIDDVLDELEFHSFAVDGGYLELEVTDPRNYVAPNLLNTFQQARFDTSDESDYESDVSSDTDNDDD